MGLREFVHKNLRDGIGFVVKVEPEDGVAAGHPATIHFDASVFKPAVVTLYDSTGEQLYEGGAIGSVVVAPTQTSWYVLTAVGPDLHEQKVIYVTVKGGASDTPAWARPSAAGPGEAQTRPPWARRRSTTGDSVSQDG